MGCLEICIYVAIILSWMDLSRLMGAMTVVQRGQDIKKKGLLRQRNGSVDSDSIWRTVAGMPSVEHCIGIGKARFACRKGQMPSVCIDDKTPGTTWTPIHPRRERTGTLRILCC
jgi:hypothetical protein